MTTAENHGENNLYVIKRGDLKVSTIVFENYFVLSISVGWMDDGLDTTPVHILGIWWDYSTAKRMKSLISTHIASEV